MQYNAVMPECMQKKSQQDVNKMTSHGHFANVNVGLYTLHGTRRSTEVTSGSVGVPDIVQKDVWRWR